MKGLVTEDPLLFDRITTGKLFMVVFSLPGSERVLTLGTKVTPEHVEVVSARLSSLSESQRRTLSSKQIESIVAITGVKLNLLSRGIAWEVIQAGDFHAEPTTIETLLRVQARLKEHPLSRDGKWLIDLLLG